MTNHEVFFLDDSKDEALLTKIFLRNAEPPVDVVYFHELDDLLVAVKSIDEERRDPPEAIVVDLNMPVTDGISSIEALNRIPSLADVPVGVCTGSSDPEDEKRARKAGAAFFVIKPFDLDKLDDMRKEIRTKSRG
ncbi:MAG: response regulator [Pseudomonadota bacterium]